ncbi:lipid II flippase Amj family protein [candidate division KSB1 bacterium]|nr:lipid II flippase Amj family protein [candidate division KSB1 bacterium]
MTTQVIIVIVFTFIIHLINTLSYSVRLVGIKTGRLAVSFALFNILVLISRTSNSLQAPLLAKKIEQDLLSGGVYNTATVFHWIILAASAGTLVGAFLIPSFQGIFEKMVLRFNVERSVSKLILHGFTKSGVKQIRDQFKIPSRQNIKHLKNLTTIPKKLVLLNVLVVSILTVGSLASLYAGYLNPELRGTAISLSAVITGTATVLMVIFIDPFFSLLTDDVLEGKQTQIYFTRCVVLMVTSRFVGTLLAQLLLYPAAAAIVFVAGVL